MKKLNLLINKARIAKTRKSSKKLDAFRTFVVCFEFSDSDVPVFYIKYNTGNLMEIFSETCAAQYLEGSL